MFEFCFGTHGFDLWNAEDRNKLRALGFRQLSIGCRDFMDGHAREDAARLREWLEGDGLLAVTSHPPFGSFNEPFSTLRQDPEGLAHDLEWMKEFILRCGLLGIKAIPLHTGGAMLPRAQRWETESARRYVEALLPAAEEAGVIIAVENTNHATPVGFYPGMTGQVPLNRNIWEFDDTDRILGFVHSFHSPFVKVCYDTGHSHLLGKMLPDLDAFLDDIALFHIHDNDGAGNDSHTQPGYGNTPWRAFFEKIKNVRAPLFVEAGPYFGDPALMLAELNAIAENRVTVKPGGFLKKDEDTGRIVILPEKCDSAPDAPLEAQCGASPVTFLFNRFNTYQDHAPREIAACGLPFIGASADVPEFMLRMMAQSAPITVYDSCRCIDEDVAPAIAVAERFSARQLMVGVGHFCDAGQNEMDALETVRALAAQCRAHNLELLLTNRRPFSPDVPVSAEKLLRLSEAAAVRIAFDAGASHASRRALEDFYDLHPRIALILLNDNLGREALCPVGHEDYIPGTLPDDMRQPGYGTAPFPALADAARTLVPHAPFLINGQKHAHATLDVVLLETRTLLAGKVYTNPAGGGIGKKENGRIIV